MASSNSLSLLLPDHHVSALVRQWLAEDSPSFDVGGFVVGDGHARARLLCKQSCVLAGRPFFEAVFKELGCVVSDWLAEDGNPIDVNMAVNGPKHIANVTGPVHKILLGERISLNCISRTSGIATTIQKLTQKAAKAGWHGRIACTRKTTPGFRLPEKYAVIVGGGDPHRYDLSSMVMLKDNHVTSVGSLTEAVQKAKSVTGFATKIEVETRSREEAMEAAANGADVVMLDNFTPEDAQGVSSELKTKYPAALVEASGGITDDSIDRYFLPSVDVISCGYLTHGYKTIDFSLKIC